MRESITVMAMDTRTFIIGIISAVAAPVVGYLAYRTARKKDAVAVETGALSQAREGTEQIFRNLNLLVDQRQEDIEAGTGRENVLRVALDNCQARVEAVIADRDRRIDAVTADRDHWKAEAFRRKYGENGT